VIAAAAVAFGAVTWWALESGEVATLRTRAAAGRVEETRVWVADAEGAVWIEAATPERAWYRRLLERPEVELVRSGEPAAFTAKPFPGPEGHTRIRELLRAKYGVRDLRVGLLQDTSTSIAVRLEPAMERAGS
jgi:hypothetical protein